MTYEHGYPGGEQDCWCLRRPRATETLCGRLVNTANFEGFFPQASDLQPTDELTQCRACVEKKALLEARKGVCRLCAAEAPLVDGRIGAHGDCAGVNLRPRGR